MSLRKLMGAAVLGVASAATMVVLGPAGPAGASAPHATVTGPAARVVTAPMTVLARDAGTVGPLFGHGAARGDCGTSDLYADSGGHWHLILNSTLGAITGGTFGVQGNGFGAPVYPQLITGQGGTRWDSGQQGPIFLGLGASKTSAAGVVIASSTVCGFEVVA